MKKHLLPLSFIGLFFFAIGFAFGINGFLTPVLKESMPIGTVAANLLIVFNFLPFLLFSHPASWCIRRFGYKRTMALSFALFALAFALFVPAARLRSIPFFLCASFLSGIANTVLQASVNPYATLLGPIESAARRISIMGICNKLAWPTTTLFMMLAVGQTEVSRIALSDLTMPFLVIVGVFVVLGVVALLAPLPEVKAEGEDAPIASGATGGRTSVWQFPHLLLGCLTLFLYVGVETIALSTVTDYATTLGLTDVALYAYIPSIGMCLGYIVGATCIPRYLSQVMAMRLCALTALLGSLLVVLLPDASLSVASLFLVALGCSLMWPALWPMAIDGLGRFTTQGAALLTMTIAGGAVMPLLRAWVEDWTGSFQQSYWVCVPCFLFILYYGLRGYRAGR